VAVRSGASGDDRRVSHLRQWIVYRNILRRCIGGLDLLWRRRRRRRRRWSLLRARGVTEARQQHRPDRMTRRLQQHRRPAQQRQYRGGPNRLVAARSCRSTASERGRVLQQRLVLQPDAPPGPPSPSVSGGQSGGEKRAAIRARGQLGGDRLGEIAPNRASRSFSVNAAVTPAASADKRTAIGRSPRRTGRGGQSQMRQCQLPRPLLSAARAQATAIAGKIVKARTSDGCPRPIAVSAVVMARAT